MDSERFEDSSHSITYYINTKCGGKSIAVSVKCIM